MKKLPPRDRPRLGDIVAGVSVALVLIPQSLAYAELAGLPAHHGLYAAAVPTIVAALFASSRYLQTGPGAMTSLLTLGVLTTMAPAGNEAFATLAALLALTVGLARIVVGTVKAGWVVYLMSQPVLMGFTSAAALLIIGSQIPTALGIGVQSQGVWGPLVEAMGRLDQVQMSSVFLSALTIVLVLSSRFVHRLFPGVLVAAVIGIVWGSLGGYRGPMVGPIPSTVPPLSFHLPWSRLPSLLIPGIVIALVGFAEVASISRAFAAQDREEWNPDKEFISQGAANLAAAVFGGFPVGGSFSRSAITRLTGGATRWSGAVTGLTVVAFLPVAGIIAHLPKAVLAGIIIGAVTNLARVDQLVRLVSRTWFQAGIAWITFALTLALSPRVDLAVLVGITLSILVHLYRESHVEVRADYAAGTVRLTPLGVLYFGSAPRLDLTFMHELAEHPDADRIIVDLGSLGRIDYTGALSLQKLVENAEGAGLDVRFADIPPQARGILTRVFGEESKLLQPAAPSPSPGSP